MATKRQIADAARRLFASHGYVATTITAIADAADIPAPTIYSAFGSKAKILQFIAWSVVATLDVDRSHQQALAESDPAQGLRLAANIQRRQYQLMSDVIAIYQEAARTDPDIAADLQAIMGNRERAFRHHLEAIAPHLAPGVTVDDGLAIYLALVLPEIHHTLVHQRGWSNDHYETWLADTLVHQLLGAPRPNNDDTTPPRASTPLR
jgi:AcrR family transcriptional regulator